MKTNFKNLVLVLLVGLVFLNACRDEETVILQGIDINGLTTNIQISESQIENIGATIATIKTTVGNIDPNYSILEHGHLWSSSNNLPTLDDNEGFTTLGALTATGEIQSDVTDLLPNTTYYVRAYFTTNQGIGYSDQVLAFTTLETLADVVVINEGNFNSADGSLSLFSTIDKSVNFSAFASTNGFPMAATIQNVVREGNNFYAVCNNPNKIEIFNAETFASITKIQPSADDAFVNPFDIAVVGNKAYVSNWGTFNNSTFQYDDPFISIIDLTTFTVTGKIIVATQPQHLLVHDSKVFVADVGSNTISVINTSTDTIDGTITVSSSPDNMLLDANDKLWVACRSGNLVRVNPDTEMVEATVPSVSIQGFNIKLVTNTTKDKLYFMDNQWNSDFTETTNNVYEFDITASTAPVSPILTGTNFYGLGLNTDDLLYVADAKAFQSNGEVIRYNLDGTEVDRFDAGRGPSGFIFR